MIFASSKLLGIAVGDRTITCAELHGRGERAVIRRTATFSLPADVSLEKPDALGKSLASFLEQQGFSGTRAVVGVPAKWLIAVEKDVPPAGRDQVRAMLRLQAERLPLAESGELVFDYVGEHDAAKPGKVLLVAMLRKQLDRIEQVMEAANLSVVAVTPTALALASAARGRTSQLGANTPILLLARHGAEVVWQRQGTPRMLRHVAVVVSNGHDLPAVAALGGDLRRAVALAASPAAPNGNGEGPGAADELVLWDGIGLNSDQVAELSERLGLKVRSGNGMAMLGLKAPPRKISPAALAEDNDTGRFAPATALAMVGASHGLLPLDFAHSRLAPPPVRRFGRRSVWIGVIAAVLVIALAALLIDNNLRERQLAQLTQERTNRAPELTEAKALQDRINIISGYIDNRTPTLLCLREITNTFRDDEQIWVVNFSLNEDRDGRDLSKLTGRLDGRTSNWGTAQELADRMRENPKFSAVSGPDVSGSQSARRGGDQWTFSIIFTYNAVQ